MPDEALADRFLAGLMASEALTVAERERVHVIILQRALAGTIVLASRPLVIPRPVVRMPIDEGYLRRTADLVFQRCAKRRTAA